MNVGLFFPSLSSAHIHQSFSNLLLVLPCLLKIPKWFYIFLKCLKRRAVGWRYQFAAMFSNGFENIFHKNKLIVFKYIRATLANNYFANQESLPLPRHQAMKILSHRGRCFVAMEKKFVFHPRRAKLKNDWILSRRDWFIYRLYRIITRH